MKAKETATWSATKVQHLYRHKSGGYYARLTLNGKKTWRSLKTDVLSIAKPRLAKMLEEERVRHESHGGKVANGSMTFSEAML